MKIQSSTSVYESFLPEALETELVPGEGPRVRYVATTSALLGLATLLLFVVEFLTVPQIASLLSWHVVVGTILTTLVLVKVGFVGYRFIKYYLSDEEFLKAGPPWIGLRYVAPPLVMVSVLLLGSGFELLFAGPSSFSVSFLAPAHTLLSIFWFFLFALHAFGYLRRSSHSVSADLRAIAKSKRRTTQTGSRTRFSILVLTVFLGLAVSYSLRGQITSWENAFHQSGRSTTPVTQPLIPTRKTIYSKHAKILAQQRERTHLNDVKAINKLH